MAKKSSIQSDIEKACIAIVDTERTNWEDATAFVTEKVAFRMRELIRVLRKNFWGVFDQPKDPQTGRDRTWVGLVMSTIENWVKNIDIDQKNIGFVARNPGGIPITEITRQVVKDYLGNMYFGETLDTDERQVLIDGTVVWKTWEENSKGKVVLRRKTVDLLNVYIDPTEENIQTAYRFTERGLLLPSQIAGMTGWMNTKDLDGSEGLSKVDGNRVGNSGTKTTGKYRDVWEMWGKMPKWLLTGDKNARDAEEEVDGHIVVSGLEANKPVLHLVEENKTKDKFGDVIKPYEEWRAAKISGRWYGLGVAERLLALQEYLNTVVNIRISRGYVSQLGLFKIKKGKGITAQMLNQLPVNGAIQVQDMDDVQQMAVSEIGQSSYNDEDVIKYWAQQVASAQPISSGEILPASATATSSAISNTNAQSGYTMFKEGMGSFITRWIDRHALKTIAKTIKVGDLVRISSDDDAFKDLVERIAISNVADALNNTDVVPTPDELLIAISNEEEKLLRSPQIFIEAVHDIVAAALDTKVVITNEEIDTSVAITNLLQLMQFEVNDPVAMRDTKKKVYDLMGLPAPKETPQQPQQQQAPQGSELPDLGVRQNATDTLGSAVGVQ